MDGAAYFGALRSSLLQAERCIYLVGWDIDSRTPIRGDTPPNDGAPERLGELLAYLVNRNNDLVVHVLLWDYSILYAFEREPLPRLTLDWRTPRRIEVCLDHRLPFGSSHHEKLAIIDERVAYCGGLDLTIRRWDRSRHRAEEPARVDPAGEEYGPYHDTQLVVDGETAAKLAGLVRQRWKVAAGSELPIIDAVSDPWPESTYPELRDLGVGIKRTRPAFEGEPELREIQEILLDDIGKAERLIYIENQYLTVRTIAQALRRRLLAKPSLEVVIVTPKSPRGWLEQQTMGLGRARFMQELAGDEIAARIVFAYPWTGPDRIPVMVHAKLMITDDRVLQIGSANLNYRSMGVDRECDLHVESQSDEQRAGIENIRLRLLAHHLGITVDELRSRELSEGSVVSVIDRNDSPERGLQRIDQPDCDESATELLVDLGDPERPIDLEDFLGNLFGAMPARPIRRHLLRLIVAAALVSVAVIAWRYSPLSQWADPRVLGGWLGRIESSRWTGIWVLATFLAGSLVAFPVTVLIAVTASVLGPTQGLIWAFAGTMLAATANFALGRLVPQSALKRWTGTWLDSVRSRLRRGGIVSMMIVRNVPVAPFTAVNLIAGAARIPFRDYLAGTALGMGPGIVALTILGDRLRSALQAFSWVNFSLLAIAIVVWIGVALGLQALSNRLSDAR